MRAAKKKHETIRRRRGSAGGSIISQGDTPFLRVDEGPTPTVAQLVECGHVLRKMNEPEQAVQSYQAALKVDPACVNALVSLGELWTEMGRLSAALESYLLAIQHDPAHVVARVNLAALLRREGHSQDAIVLLEPIVDRCDAIPTVRFNLANALADVGRFEEARGHYAALMAVHPQPAKVLYNLSQITKFRDADRDRLATWESQASRSLDAVEQKAYLHFALGKACNDLGDYDQAWSHFTAGNQNADHRFDATQHDALISRACEVFSKSTLDERRGWGHPGEAPVFIVGMPRSGTSLIERILGSHSQVQATGESLLLGQIVAEWALSLDLDADDPEAGREFCPQAAQVMAQRYLEGVDLRPDAVRFTDKMPANFLLLGWIAACFPRARVIHCRRDPRDVCLSCYCQHFANPQPFAYDLDHLVAYYRGYERLMDHWRTALPISFLEVDYERLIASPEDETRRLVDFCGLGWEPSCLASHDSQGLVKTASLWQVRQPIYGTSRGRWRNYARHIAPLLEAFGNNEVV